MRDCSGSARQSLGRKEKTVVVSKLAGGNDVGSGLSQRYLQTPGWKQLIEYLCDLAEEDPQYVISRANGNLALAATNLSEGFHEKWWRDERFEGRRAKYRSHQSSVESPIKCEVVNLFPDLGSVIECDPERRAEIDLLCEANIAGAITTNYDHLVETVFPQFKVFVGQASMLLSNPLGVAELYKIHGCCSDPNSIVLTQKDYERYEEDNPYLMAKLLSIFVEHPIIFLGYSIQDPNIKSILRAIGSIAQRNDLLDLTDKIIFVEWDRSGSDPSVNDFPVWIENVSLPITRIRVPHFIGIFRELTETRDRLPMRVIRQFQAHVYDIVKGKSPAGNIAVMNLEEVEKYEDVEWAVGLGIKSTLERIGFSAYARSDLFVDFLKPVLEIDPQQVIDLVVPRLARTPIQYLPIYRYLRAAGYLTDHGEISIDEDLRRKIGKFLKTSVSDFRPSKSSQDSHFRRWEQYGPNIRDVIASTSLANGLTTIATVMPEMIGTMEVQSFLFETKHVIQNGESGASNWAKLAAQLDFLLYGSMH